MRRFEHGGDIYSHPDAVDFSASLNPLGMPQATRDALRDAVDRFEAYPDPICRGLRERIAALEGVAAGQVVVCAGATDALARICSALKPERALVCAPAYSGYEQALCQAGSQIVRHFLAREEDFELGEDILAELEQPLDILFIANPNNPTGRTVDPDLLERIVAAADARRIRVVLDECFIGFTAARSSVRLTARFENLVVVKAFTKLYALAGLRLGYLVATDAGLIDAVYGAGQPWAVSTPAQVAGVAALEDEAYIERTRRYVADERTRLERELEAQGFEVVHGEANYVLFRSHNTLGDALLAQGFLVRNCDNFIGLDDTWYRIAVRTRAENEALLEAISSLDGSDHGR